MNRHLSDGNLRAALDGELAEPEMQHLLACPACQLCQEQIRQQVQYVVVGGFNLKENDTTLDAWLQSAGAELVATTNATLKVAEGLQPWYIVRFKP